MVMFYNMVISYIEMLLMEIMYYLIDNLQFIMQVWCHFKFLLEIMEEMKKQLKWIIKYVNHLMLILMVMKWILFLVKTKKVLKLNYSIYQMLKIGLYRIRIIHYSYHVKKILLLDVLIWQVQTTLKYH